jgi:hypothetical protein
LGSGKSGEWLETDEGEADVRAALAHDDMANPNSRLLHRSGNTEKKARDAYGNSTRLLEMIKGNSTCGSEDIWGIARPRDVRLQIYISFALGLGAFLTFCVRCCKWKTGAYPLTGSCSFSAHGGKASTLHARSRTTSRRHCLSFLTASLAGSFRYGGSRTSRCWLRQAWMPTSTSPSSRWP